MPLAILAVAAVLGVILGRFTVTGLQRRQLVREAAAPQQEDNNVFEQGLHILGRVGMAVIAVNRFENGLDGVDLMDRNERAESYLRGIVALTGATQVDNAYVLDVGKARFNVRYRYVWRMPDVTDPTRPHGETCFYLAQQDMPRAEQIATALLQLKNNPAVFDRWAVQRDLAFKADGTVFSFSHA